MEKKILNIKDFLEEESKIETFEEKTITINELGDA